MEALTDKSSYLSNTITVELYESHLKEKTQQQRLFGRIKQHTVSIAHIIQGIHKKTNTVLSRELLQYSAMSIAQEMQEQLALGRAIEIPGIGKVYVAIEGELKPDMTPSEIRNHLTLRFTPSAEALAIVKHLDVTCKHPADTGITILGIKNHLIHAEPGVLYMGNTFSITGRHLKLGGSVNGIYLAPVDKNGVALHHDSWIPLPYPYINTPKMLSLYLPKDFAEGTRFRIAIVTSLANNGTERKEPVKAFSDLVTICNNR
ncbi:MAG: DUF4469 domain-containing protein [Treponema sp.]|nr:DUF4469 domain-containing protein [Treponema sp.]